METYGVPLLCLLLNFLAFTACMRFLFSRQGFYWIVPLLVTIFLLWPNALRLYQVAGNGAIQATGFSYFDLQPLLLSLLWYAMIVTFHYALKKTIRANYHHEQVKKNLHEARYQMSVESVTHQRKEQRRKHYFTNAPARTPRLQAYSSEWTDLFDQR